jgi:dATP pyrophosphohydrolase
MEPTIRSTVGLVMYHAPLQRYLILRRNPKRYKGWGLIKGGIDQGETAEQACIREVLEEVGVLLTSECLIDLLHCSAYFDNGKQSIVVVRWFFTVLNEPVVIKLEQDEWISYRWATYDETLYELVWQSQQQAVRIAAQRFNETMAQRGSSTL